MSQFSIERDKQKLIPYIKAALAVAPGLHLWASPWSPPTWMKSNGAFDGGTIARGVVAGSDTGEWSFYLVLGGV